MAALAICLAGAVSIPASADAFAVSAPFSVNQTFYNTWAWTQTQAFQPNYPSDPNAFVELLNQRFDSADPNGNIYEAVSYCQGSCFGGYTSVFAGLYYNGLTGEYDHPALVAYPRADNISNGVSIASASQVHFYVDGNQVGYAPASSWTGYAMYSQLLSYDSHSDNYVEGFTSGVQMTGMQTYAGGSSWNGWPANVNPGNSIGYQGDNTFLSATYSLVNGYSPTATWMHT